MANASRNRSASATVIPQTRAPDSPPPAAGAAVARVLLSALFTVTASTTVETLRTTGALIAVLALPALTFLLLATGEHAGAGGITHLGGHLGILTALVASSMWSAIVLNSTGRRIVLPVLPRS